MWPHTFHVHSISVHLSHDGEFYSTRSFKNYQCLESQGPLPKTFWLNTNGALPVDQEFWKLLGWSRFTAWFENHCCREGDLIRGAKSLMGRMSPLRLPSWTQLKSESVSHTVMSYYLWPHGLLSARLLCPWDSPCKNIGVGCHFCVQEIFPIQRSNASPEAPAL